MELDKTICPNCKSEETFHVNDFLDRGLEYRECEDCQCEYKVHFHTVVTKIEIEGEKDA